MSQWLRRDLSKFHLLLAGQTINELSSGYRSHRKVLTRYQPCAATHTASESAWIRECSGPYQILYDPRTMFWDSREWGHYYPRLADGWPPLLVSSHAERWLLQRIPLLRLASKIDTWRSRWSLQGEPCVRFSWQNMSLPARKDVFIRLNVTWDTISVVRGSHISRLGSPHTATGLFLFGCSRCVINCWVGSAQTWLKKTRVAVRVYSNPRWNYLRTVLRNPWSPDSNCRARQCPTLQLPSVRGQDWKHGSSLLVWDKALAKQHEYVVITQ